MQTADFRVSPISGGWIVECPQGFAPLVFKSGGRAEAKADALARAMAATGVDARVTVLDRAGQRVGAKRFPAPAQLARSRRPSELAPA